MLEKNRGNNNGIGTAGVAHIIIPDGVSNIKDYIAKCYRNHMVSIGGGFGCSNLHNVKITEDVLNQIKFPVEGEDGSTVVWVRDSFYNRAIIIGILKTTGESGLTGKGQQRIYQEIADQIAEIFLDSSNGKLNINLLGNKNVPGNITIKVSGNKDSDSINIESDNALNENCKTLSINCTNNFSLLINDGLNDLFKIYGNSTEFHILDQFGNETIYNKDNIQFKTIKYNIGTGKEPIPLGNTLKDLLGELIDAINSLTVPTPHGPSGTPLNAATFTSIKGKLGNILSQLSNTD
jgi:hypothetical protein